MTRRQISAVLVFAALITLAGVASVVAVYERGQAECVPVQIGVIEPEPIVADTLSSVEKNSRRQKKKKIAVPDLNDSPLYHETDRTDIPNS